MKFTIEGPLKDNIYNIMRKAGYAFLDKDEEKNEMAFARPSRGYPRFHIYLKAEGSGYVFNLHLDQKKPIYKGAPAHAGEYEGKLVEAEAERIKKIS